MEQLRPRIRPKAPASLKENVLKAVSQDGLLANRQAGQSSRRAATWRITLAAAAVLLLGIMTFVLWLNRDRHSSHESAPVLIAEKAGTKVGTKAVKEAVTNVVKEVGEAVSHKYAEPSAAMTTPTETKSETTATAPLSAHSGTTVPFHSAQQPTATKLLAVSSSTATSQAEQHTTPLPHREGLGESLPREGQGESLLGESLPRKGQGVGLSPLERQLLANFEAHRDLVNARLAEELAQARFTQERIGQTTREYLQQYLDLQERIMLQLREDIEDIAPEKNNPKEV
ncbi:MAG: hypothetical protein J6M41_04195 [Prevotella sp.]|nr:hypothetical protein [Prevotella sp.]